MLKRLSKILLLISGFALFLCYLISSFPKYVFEGGQAAENLIMEGAGLVVCPDEWKW